MSLVDYEFARYYAMETYVRRDVFFIMKNVFGGGGSDSNKGGTTLIIPQPEIEEWIKKQYEGDNKE